MIEGPTTFGEALRDIQRQIDKLKGSILAALGDHVLTLALWIYHRAGRSLLALEIAKLVSESAVDELAALRGVDLESLRDELTRDIRPRLEGICGFGSGIKRHTVGSLPLDCQECHDHIWRKRR